ncbi:hypothetical protein NDU88_004398 [Pleurodeles waltl]|uniref:Uncharacterized protein n=1 Tax=Pleurodeles waltl TaxID=8319 RepID=A0AAV7TU41_PLEWA|nr:hypothetical protein NDU88_004398 [Pleurodeles waltl]
MLWGRSRNPDSSTPPRTGTLFDSVHIGTKLPVNTAVPQTYRVGDGFSPCSLLSCAALKEDAPTSRSPYLLAHSSYTLMQFDVA